MSAEHDPYQLQRLLDRRGFLGVSAAGVGALLAFPGLADAAAAAAHHHHHPRLGAGAPYAPQAPFALDADCVLSEDHFLVKLAAIDPIKDEVVAYSWADGEVEAMLLQGQNISQVYRDATAAGGWNVRPIAADAKDMVAGVAADDQGALALHVFYRNAANTVTHLIQASQGAPGKPTMPTRTTETLNCGPGKLQVTSDPLQNLLVFCLTPSSAPSQPDGQLWFYWTGSDGGKFAGLNGRGLTYGVLSGFAFSLSDKRAVPVGACAVVSYALSDVGGSILPTLMLYLPGVYPAGVAILTYALPGDGDTKLNIRGDLTLFGHQPSPPPASEIISIDHLSAPDFYFLPTAIVRTYDQRLYTLSHDFAKNIWYWQQLSLPPSSDPASQRPGGLQWQPSNQQVAPVNGDKLVETNNLINLFLVTPGTVNADGTSTAAGTLSVVRQAQQSTPTQDGVTPVFNPAVPLQGNVAAVASQARPSRGDELIVVGTNGNLQVLTKSATGDWISSDIHLPAAETWEINTYRVQLTLTDAWSAPVANQQLSITSSVPATALVNGQGIALSATSVTVTTDASGHALVAILADGLFAPILTVGGPKQLPSAISVSPNAAVNAYMSGTTTLNYLPNFSAATLTNATIGNKVLAPGAKDAPIAADAFDVLSGAAKAATNPESPTLTARALGRQQHPVSPAHRVGSRHPRPGGRAVAHSHKRERRVAAHGQHPHPPLRLGSAPPRAGAPITVGKVTLHFSDLAKDALYAIKTGATKVSHIVVEWDEEAKNWVATVTADFKAWADQAVPAVITGLEDAAHVFHSVINHLEALVDDFVDWLKAHILTLLADTVKVAGLYHGWLGKLVNQLDTLDDRAKNAANDYFAKQKTTIHAQLDAFTAHAQGQSVSSLGNGARVAQTPTAAARAPNLGAASPAPTADSASGAHGRWLLDKLGQATVTASKPVPVSSELQDAITTLGTALVKSGGQFATGVVQFRNTLTAIVDNPKKFGTAGVANLIAAVEKVIDAGLDLADAIAIAVLRLVKAAIDGLATLIDTSLSDLPLLGLLLNEAGLDTKLPSIGQIVTIVIAFPTVLAYKLAHGADAIPFKTALSPQSRRLRGASGTTAGPSIADDLTFAASGASFLWAYLDTVSGILTGVAKEADQGPPDVFAWFDILMPLAIGCLTLPAADGRLPFTSTIDFNSPYDEFSALAWVADLAPGLFAGVSYFASKQLATETANGVSDSMLTLTGMSGFLAAGFGITAAFMTPNTSAKDDILPAAISLLGNISPALSDGRSTGAVKSSDGTSAVAVSIIGGICSTVAASLAAGRTSSTVSKPAPNFTG